MGVSVEFTRTLLAEHYANLGEITALTDLKAGDTNHSFLAVFEKNGVQTDWYVRQYSAQRRETEIIYEHAFDRYFAQQHGTVIESPVPVENIHGTTWISAAQDGTEHFYAVFNTISGKEPYSWEFNDMSPAAFDACAVITAQFHAWSYGFKGPKGSGRLEPPLTEQYSNWRKDIPKSVSEKKQNAVFARFNGYFEKEVPFLLDTIDFLEEKTREYAGKLPVCINHEDLNPGNVMFDENDRVCCVFDLDWVTENLRLYDIGWMGYQSCACWDVHRWGEVPAARIVHFVEVYNRTIQEMACPLGVLTQEERAFLPIMMMIGAAKVIADFVCYEEHSHEPYRLFVNTWRFMESLRYMREHLAEFSAALKEK